MDPSYLNRLPGAYGQHPAAGGLPGAPAGWQGNYTNNAASFGGAYGASSLPQSGAGASLQAQAQGYGSLYMPGGQQGLQSASAYTGMPGSVPGGMQSFQAHPGTNILGRQGGRASSWDQQAGHMPQDGQAGASSSGFQAVGSGFQAYQVQQPQQPQGALDMANLPPVIREKLLQVPAEVRGAYIAKFQAMVRERQAQQGFQPAGFQQPGLGASRGQQQTTRPQPGRQSWDSAGEASPSTAPSFHGGVQGLLPNSEFGSGGTLNWQQQQQQPQTQTQTGWGMQQSFQAPPQQQQQQQQQQQEPLPQPKAQVPQPQHFMGSQAGAGAAPAQAQKPIKPPPVDICSVKVVEARKKQLRQALAAVLSKAPTETTQLMAKGGKALEEAPAPVLAEPTKRKQDAPERLGDNTKNTPAKVEGMEWITKEGELDAFDPDDPALLVPPPPIDPAVAHWRKRRRKAAYQPVDCSSEPTVRVKSYKEALRFVQQGWSECSSEEKAAGEAVLRRVFGKASRAF